MVQDGREYSVTATYDGIVARIFVDGSLYGRSDLSAASCRLPALCSSGMPFARALLGASFTLIILAVGSQQRRRSLVVFGLAGAIASAVFELSLQRIFSATPMSLWPASFALLGGLCLFMAIRRD
jgi:hypothetical protein